MGKSVTAQALASQGGSRPGVPSQGLTNHALDQSSVALPITQGNAARRATGATKTAAAKPSAVKTTGMKTAGVKPSAAKAVAETAKGVASQPGANPGGPRRASGGLKTATAVQARADQARTERRRIAEQSDVLVSAVISTYLLTHLHHVLQRAEFGAEQEGRAALAANYAQLRKVLCLDARTMEDASASGQPEDAPQAA